MVHEALGLPYDKVLNCSIALIESMMQEFAYITNERNKAMRNEDSEDSDYEWVELPSFDDPSKTIRMKKYHDIGSKVHIDAHL